MTLGGGRCIRPAGRRAGGGSREGYGSMVVVAVSKGYRTFVAVLVLGTAAAGCVASGGYDFDGYRLRGTVDAGGTGSVDASVHDTFVTPPPVDAGLPPS